MTAAKRYVIQVACTLTTCQLVGGTNLWIILGIACMQRDGFEVQAAIEIDGRDNVLKGRDDPFNGCDMLLLEGKRSRGGRDLSRWR
jgi:hypothetical protein